MQPFLSRPTGIACPGVSTNLPPHPRRAEAEALLREGKHPREVAETVGACLRVVNTWRKRLDLPPLPRPGRSAAADAQGVRAEAVRMLQEGRPPREIAEQLGVTAARIRQIRAEMGPKK